ATYAADVLSTALQEPSSRFQKALVDSGACVGVNIGWFTQVNTGPITLGFAAMPDKVDACVSAIQGELAKMTSADYVAQDELRRGAHTLEIQNVQARERPSQLAHTLTFWWTSGGIDYWLGYVDNLYKVAPADAGKFISTYVTNQPFIFGVMVSPEMKKSGLDQKHFDALIEGGAR
ncbi:MAG TPA: insulinase family protein, partial [Kofleriaceae bacterium]|nr:insulinase family protein [Kofleriaceae bacterium]